MKNLVDKKVAIVGGGPGGLTLARLLQQAGVDVNVYERDASEHARPKGATLDLHEDSGLRALRGAHLMEEFEANYRPGADRMHLMDQYAQTIIEETEDNDRSRPEIDRGPLQKILLDSLLPGTVVWDSHFTSMDQQNGVWKLNFKNGEEVFADLVVAADGANSKIRPYLTPLKPLYSGVTAIEGAVYDSAKNCPKVHRLLNGGKIFAFGNSQSLIVSSKGDGSLVFYLSFKCDENWFKTCGINFHDKAEILCWFKQTYQNWDNFWLELFENATGSFIPRPLYYMPFDQTWTPQPNLTILGDAAHLMPPFAGEGVNMAMLDALELSERLLTSEYTLHQAIAAYENEMRKRCAEMAQTSMEATDVLHSPKALEFMASIAG